MTIAVTAFAAEKMLKGVSGVARTFGLVGRVVGPGAARVADRTVEEHVAAAAHAELDRRVDAAPVEAADGLPDALDAGGVDADLGRVDLRASA